jgi:ClpP class serine protease
MVNFTRGSGGIRMSYLLAHPALFTTLAAALLMLGTLTFLFAKVQKAKRIRKKAINSRAERARMTYDDFTKEYRKAFEALENKGYCVLDVIHDLSDEFRAKDGAHQFIAYEEASALCEKIRRSKTSPLLLILHTLGGYSFPSEMIANAIKKHPGKKESQVPYVAMSGGTVIALATDKIHMGKDAFLGPIDTQYRGYPAAAFDLLKKDKHPDAISDEVMLTSYMVDQHKQSALQRAVNVLNEKHQVKGDKEFVVRELMEKGRHHAEPISPAEAEKIKINVDTSVLPDVYTLVDARLGMLRTFDQKNDPSHPANPDAPQSMFRRIKPFGAPQSDSAP